MRYNAVNQAVTPVVNHYHKTLLYGYKTVVINLSKYKTKINLGKLKNNLNFKFTSNNRLCFRNWPLDNDAESTVNQSVFGFQMLYI